MWQPMGAKMTTSSAFHIRHWSSGMFIHPDGGVANHGTPLVVWEGAGAEFHLEFCEGPWGYLVPSQNTNLCVHPEGGQINSHNGTRLLFHEDRHPGAYFTVNESSRTLMHIGGLFWHPHGGASLPGHGTGIVLWESFRDGTKFYATNGDANQLSLDLPVSNQSAGWRLVFAENHPLSDRTVTFKAKVGRSVTNSSTFQITTTFKAEMEGQLFGQKSKASLAIQTAYSQTNSQTWTQEQEQDVTYTVKKNEPIAVWQRVFNATFNDGSIWTYGSGNVFYDTTSSNTPPPSDA